MKLKIIILFILFGQTLFCQNFTKDWEKFDSKNWKISFENPELFLERKTVGEIKFENNTDSKKSIKYYVYLSNEITPEFKKKISFYYYVQSCFFEKTEYIDFESFHFGKYFYLVEGCHHCDRAKFTECVELAQKIYEYVYK